MATVILGSIGLGVGSLFGAPQLGLSVGTFVGSLIDQSLQKPASLGRLTDVRVLTSAYGTLIPQVWGSFRLNGCCIWSDPANPKETRHKHSAFFGLVDEPSTYTYTASFAVLVCRGPVTRINQIVAGDRVLYNYNSVPPTQYTIRIYLGDETQTPDPLISAIAGSQTPGYRGSCYVVFENLPLADFGNQIPNPLSFDVVNADSSNLANDSFNRANGNIGTADSGQVWQFTTTQAQIFGNAADTTGTPGYPNWIETGHSDVSVQLTNTQFDVTGTSFVVVRLTDENNRIVFGDMAGFGPAGYAIQKVIGGVRTVLTSSLVNGQAGDVLRVDCLGPLIQAYVNGVLVASVSESFNQTATKHGFSGGQLIDNWSAVIYQPSQSHVSTILADLFTQAGLSGGQYNVAAATDVVDGFVLTDRQDARSLTQPLLTAYDTYLAEVDGQIKALKRGAAAVATIPAGDLAARLVDGPESDPPPTLTIPKTAGLDLPFRVELTFYGQPYRNYLQSMQAATRYTKSWLQNVQTLTFPLVLTEDYGRQVAEKLLYRAWLEAEMPSFSLPPKYLYLAPGDVLNVPTPAGNLSCRIQQLDLALPGPIQVTAVLDDAPVLSQSVSGGTVVTPVVDPADVINTTLIAWSGNALIDSDASSIGLYLEANGSTAGFWQGCTVYVSRDSGASYQEFATIRDPATIGTAATVLAAGTVAGDWDVVNSVTVNIVSGSAPTSTSDADVIAGSNAALLGDEVIQFATVTPLGGNQYQLSRLLRGRRGTDGHWSEHVSGERFCLVDSGLTKRVVLEDALFGRPILVKAIGNGQAIASVSPTSVTIFGEERKPYAPTAVAGTRDGSNNLTVTFTRRTRTGAGLPSPLTIPLGETTEQYEVDFLAGSPVTISAITNANPPVITATAHGFSNGQKVYLTGIVGMVRANGIIGTVAAVTTNTFQLSDFSTLYLNAYISGGTAERVLRTFTPTSPTQVYSAAQQTSDGLVPPAPVRCVIFQRGANRLGYPAFAVV